MTTRAKLITLFLIAAALSELSGLADGTDAPRAANSNGKTHLLVVGTATIADPTRLKEIAAAAVSKVADAARATAPGIVVDAVAEAATTKQQYLRGEVDKKVTPKIFKERLVKTVKPEDTVIIYTHSHGRRSDLEASQPLGGIVLDVAASGDEHRGTVLWDEYVELLLEIPAKNVVVLTMSCFSGGLVEHLKSPEVRARWESRREKDGRNLIVLTSQSCTLTSGPIVKEGEVINPFTYAVSRMLAGEADDFNLVNGKPGQPLSKDGKLTVGEMIDYVLYTTQNVASEHTRLENTARPQLTGSFDRGDVLRFGARLAFNENAVPSVRRSQPLVRPGPDRPVPAHLVDQAFRRNDTDGDGCITSDEARPFIKSHYGAFDADGDGVIDRQEFDDAAPKYLQNPGRQRVRR